MRQPRGTGWLWLAAIICCGPKAVSAQTPAASIAAPSAEPAGTPSDRLSGGARPERFLFYSGFDIWHFGYAGYVGAQWAPRSLNNDGFVLSAFASNGVEHYNDATTHYRTGIFRAAILPGWRFKRGNLEIKVFGGPDFESDDLSPVTPGAKSRRNSVGARAMIDLWWQPTPLIMVSASASATTIANGYNARAATGWRVLDAFWIGPEISASADRFSDQYRIGAHLTGLRTAALEWSLAAGLVQDSFRRNGIYGRIGVLARH